MVKSFDGVNMYRMWWILLSYRLKKNEKEKMAEMKIEGKSRGKNEQKDGERAIKIGTSAWRQGQEVNGGVSLAKPLVFPFSPSQ